MAARRKPRTRLLRKKLTQKYLKSILSYNPITGIFRWKKRPTYPQHWNTQYANKIAGSFTSRKRQFIRIHKWPFKASHIAWRMQTGKWPRQEIDHKNTDPSDNRWKNIRPATRMQNSHNRRKLKTNGFKGVFFSKEKWRARITCAGKQYNLGTFYTAHKAYASYCKAAKKLHGKFARLH